MKNYPSDKIRNIGIVAHGGAGKTSLTEAILFNAGLINRLGKVDEGSTITDYLPEEIKRKVTINSALAPFEWKGHKVNLIDTPGYSDFIGEVKAALKAVDNLLMLVCAVSGVEVQTEVIWEFAEETNIPRIFFINKLDRENANFNKVLTELQEKFGNGVVPLHIPIGIEENFIGIVDILDGNAYKFQNGQMITTDIPAELEEKVQEYLEMITEAAAESDDELLLKYLEGDTLTKEEIENALKLGIKSGKIFPVLCGSALNNIAIQPLMDLIVQYLPSPIEFTQDDILNMPPSALVFKTIIDPYVGKVNFFRVFTGIFHADGSIFNSSIEKEEKLSGFVIQRGKHQEAISQAVAGDIVAVSKLQDTLTGHTLTVKGNDIQLEGIDFPEPTLGVALFPKTRGDEDKVSTALTKLLEEDPTLKIEKNIETKESILWGMGDLHIDIISERLQSRYGVEVETKPPKVPYRETIKESVKIQGKHKKQSGGAGQYGDVWLVLEPFNEGDFEFAEEIFGGAVPKNYFPAVEKGIKEAMNEGVLAKYPVTNVKVTLVDGSYHPVDSNEMAFKIAASLAFKKGMEKASPTLLEPIMTVEIIIPEQFMGDIMGDLNGKRGKILGMDSERNNQKIKAYVPLSEMYSYATDLKSITQGRGKFHMEFSHYEEVPSKIAEEIIL